MSRIHALKKRAYRHLHALSLTKRLVAVVVLMVLVAYFITTSVTTMLLRGYLTDRVDADLNQYISTRGQSATANFLRDSLESPSSDGRTPPSSYYVFFTPVESDRDVRVLVMPSDEGVGPDLGRPGGDTGRAGDEPVSLEAVGGDQWRVLSVKATAGQQEGTLSVALPLTSVNNTVKQLWVLTSFVGLGTLVAVALLGWLAVRRAFRPLSRIEDTAAAIAAGDLTRRIPDPGADDEVSSLSHSLNAMLARIEAAFAVREGSELRMRQFVADASHELRTPLATVRGYAELYRAGAVTEPEDVAGAMTRIENEATRMTRLVEDLLLLTRWDTAPRLEHEPVDLTVLVADVVQDARVRAPHRSVTMRPLPGGTGPPVTVGDDGALRQVLTNLVANSIAHTPEGTPIEVAVGVQAARCVVEVCDHGSGIEPGTADRVFERFYRADASRSRERGGTGLGLAIVATIVARHGGTVRHYPTPGGGATFRVELPVQSRTPAKSSAPTPVGFSPR